MFSQTAPRWMTSGLLYHKRRRELNMFGTEDPQIFLAKGKYHVEA